MKVENKTNKKVLSDKECMGALDKIDCQSLQFDQCFDYAFEKHFNNTFESDFNGKFLPSKEKLTKLLMQSVDFKKGIKAAVDDAIEQIIFAFENAEEIYKEELEERKQEETERLEERKQEETERLEEEKYLLKQEKMKKAKLTAKAKLSDLTPEQREALKEAYGIAV